MIWAMSNVRIPRVNGHSLLADFATECKNEFGDSVTRRVRLTASYKNKVVVFGVGSSTRIGFE